MTATVTATRTALLERIAAGEVLTPADRAALGVVTSTTHTTNTRAHKVRAIGRQHADDAAPMGECTVCATVGEWNALTDLAPNAYGCSGRAPYDY
jgi:hypothetical protein